MRLHQLWDQEPSNLGAHLTCAGILLLIIVLTLNRLVPHLTYDSDDLVQAAFLWGYAAVLWLMWLVGGVLICVGSWRIFTIDSR
jgi:hypothetical protein